MRPAYRRLVWVAAILLVLALGFTLYVQADYPADPAAQALAASAFRRVKDGYILDGMRPVTVLFYPGGKVEPESYAPLLEKIARLGVSVKIYTMPFDLAVFSPQRASKDIAKLSPKEHIIMMGHSLGGAMAAKCAASHADRIDRLVLLGAYPIGDFPDANIRVILGSLETDLIRSVESMQSSGRPIELSIIIGGNHAQFGDYGPQRGDPEASIPRALQQEQVVDLMRHLIDALDPP